MLLLLLVNWSLTPIFHEPHDFILPISHHYLSDPFKIRDRMYIVWKKL